MMEEANRFSIPNKGYLKEMTERYAYFLPKASAFVSMEYIALVLAEKVYAPKYVDIKIRPCPRPPPKELIL